MSSQPLVTYENYLAGAVVILVASPGVVLNSLSAVMLAYLRGLKGSFAALCITNCTVNLAILLIFIGWAAPSLFLGRTPTGGFLDRVISQASFALWLGSVNCQTLLASNRFIAIYFPLRYEQIYSKRNVAICLIVFVCITIIAPAIGFQDGCNFFFDAQAFVWLFNSAPCGSYLFFWMGFMYEIVVFLIVITLDAAIFWKLKLINKNHARLSTENQKKLVQDKRFFWQAFLTNLNFTFVLLNFNVIRPLMKTTMGGFVVVTVVWELGHTLDGLILVLSNRQIRKRFFRPRQWINESTSGFVKTNALAQKATQEVNYTVQEYKLSMSRLHSAIQLEYLKIVQPKTINKEVI